MKLAHWTALAALALVLAISSCAQAALETPIPTIALDFSPSEVSNVLASAQVVPAQEARLSFVVPGPIKEVTVQEGEMVEIGQTLASLNSPDLEYAILQAEAAVRSAEREYEYRKLPRDGDRTIEIRELAEQNLNIAKRALERTLAEMEQTLLVAPFDATVVEVDIHPGEYVQPGQVVIVIAKLDTLKIETTDLSELNIAAVEIGQSAAIFVEALDNEYPGEVTAISPISNTIGGDVVYKVTSELIEQPTSLLWGMSADVEIQMEQ